MISFNKLDDVSPTDPLYYTPRQPRSVKDLSSKPFVVPEDAWAERQPAERQPIKAMPHPLSPEIVPAPPESTLQRLAKQTKWQFVAAGVAAVVVAGVLAFVAVGALMPSPQADAANPAPAQDPASPSPLAKATADATPASAGDAADRPDASAAPDASEQQQTSEQSDALLQQFLNWDKNKSSSRAP